MIDENDRKPRPLFAARAAKTPKNRALARQPRSRAKFFSSLLGDFPELVLRATFAGFEHSAKS